MLTGTTLLTATTILTLARALANTEHAALAENLVSLLVDTLTLAGNRRADVEHAIALLDDQLWNATRRDHGPGEGEANT